MNQLNYFIDFYFPPEWIKGSLVLSLFSTLVLIGLFAYLNRHTQRRYFTLWTGAWGFYAVWIIGLLYFIQAGNPAHLEWLNLFALGGCAFLLFCGTIEFADQPRGRRELALFLLLIIFGNFLVRDRPVSRYWLSVFFFCFVGLTCWCIASYYLRQRLQERYIGAWLMTVGFFLMGGQMMGYPFLSQDPFYRSMLFVTGSAIQLEIAIAMIVLVLEETRREHKSLRAQMKTTIRETRSLQRRAQLTEKKYASLFDHSTDAILICDPTTLGVEDANRAAERLTGYPRNELRKLNVTEICPALKEKESELIRDPEKVPAVVRSIGNLPIERKDGGLVLAEGVANYLRNNGSSTVELFLREVTERRTLEQKLMQAEKLSVLGQLITGVAHELNNPLSVIVGYCQLLAQRPHVDEKSKNDLLKVQHESERAARIVKNFLTFARRHPTEKKAVCLHDLIRSCLELSEYELRASGVQVRKEFVEDIPGCYADEIQLEQVFLNLINNAVHAMEGRESKKLTIRTEVENLTIRVRFIDNGPGIPPNVLARLFDPASAAREQDESRGVGLSISYSIVKNHLGRLYAENHGGGSTFTVELPATIRTGPVGEHDAAWAGWKTLKDLPGSFQVLVVDDEATIQDLFCELFPEEKFYVEGALNGQVAHRLIEHKEFDLIICDLKMAPMDGRALYEKVVSAKPHMRKKFLFVTGDTNSPETLQFLKNSGAPWVAKPFRLAELEDQIVARLRESTASQPQAGAKPAAASATTKK